jgi:hypothetical protein
MSIRVDDSRPAVRMRLALARDRRDGLTWSSKRYAELVRAALSGTAGREREDWLEVLRGQEKLWSRAYNRTDAPRTPLVRDLLKLEVA